MHHKKNIFLIEVLSGGSGGSITPRRISTLRLPMNGKAFCTFQLLLLFMLAPFHVLCTMHKARGGNGRETILDMH